MNACHAHGVYYGNDNWDAECCICCANPCGAVTVEMAVAHEQEQRHRDRQSHEAEIAYVLEHGHRQEVPF